MIQYIADRLNKWGSWCRRFEDGGLGFGNSVLARYGEPGSGGGGGLMGIVDADMLELDHIVVCLPDALREAVNQCHRMPGTKEQHAQACGCAVRTYFDRVHKAHVLVTEALQVGVGDVPELKPGLARLKLRVERLKENSFDCLTA
ncbi:hypothetical protein [Amantichitinum ursilacus]|nr:hypothetical protein [Amantichitinum ursilacus]